MTLDFTYYVCFGSGDFSETLDWSEDLTPEEEALVFQLMSEGKLLEDAEEFRDVFNEAYDCIYEQEKATYCEMYEDDEEECERFDEYYLTVHVCEPELDEDELNRVLELIFKAHPEDAEKHVDAFRNNHYEEFDALDDESEFIFSAAVRNGNADYVSAHVGDVELNCEDGYCPYLYNTEDEDTVQVLLDGGAVYDSDHYSEYDFAIETVNGMIYAFSERLQKEAFAKYLEKNGLSEDQVIKVLQAAEDDGEIDEDYEYIVEELSYLGIYASNDKIGYNDMVDSEDGLEAQSVLEGLGYCCSFEGDDWLLQATGYSYIDLDDEAEE